MRQPRPLRGLQALGSVDDDDRLVTFDCAETRGGGIVLAVERVTRGWTKPPTTSATTTAAACEFACKPFSISPPLHRRRAAWFNSTRAFDIGKARRILNYQPKIPPSKV